MARSMAAVTAAVGLVVLAACLPADDGPWFDGDLAAARRAAAERDTLVMLELRTDWCSWCRRLDTDTFSEPAVRRLLGDLVAVRLDAEGEGRALARELGVEAYPTIVFSDAGGAEVDRIVGFLPPDRFVAEVERIRAGDTFVACLEQLSAQPGDGEAVRRAVAGLLERSDPVGAIARLDAFRAAAGDGADGSCRPLLFEARAALLEQLYQRAAKLHRRGWGGGLEVPDTVGVRHLRQLAEADPTVLSQAELGERLRAARRADAAEVLATTAPADPPPAALPEVADFAFRNGLYGDAAEVYRRWAAGDRTALGAGELNQAAWQLYLARLDLPLALELAQAAWARAPEPDVADTLGRLLYLRGEVGQALELQRRAVADAPLAERALFDRIAELMSRGQRLDDRPGFEDYP